MAHSNQFNMILNTVFIEIVDDILRKSSTVEGEGIFSDRSHRSSEFWVHQKIALFEECSIFLDKQLTVGKKETTSKYPYNRGMSDSLKDIMNIILIYACFHHDKETGILQTGLINNYNVELKIPGI